MIGKTVGPYRIVARLGKGGMGDVYRAHDPRLARDVAIKSLPEALAAEPDRVARFEREAQLIASLDHPHIGAIYGIEQVGEARFLVLELVEGGTLADRLVSGGIPLGRALSIARQIADAFEAAHAKGIVHRDLKPANIGLTADDVVKVLDFGIARTTRAVDTDQTSAPTAASVTRAGSVIGTAAYMSPEQARGLPVDRRADIWAFGVVLFEMLAGRRPFEGPTTSDVIARVLEYEPDWDGLPAATPPRIRLLLRRCLAKDLRKRLHDMGDALLEIDEELSHPGSDHDGVAVPGRLRSRERVVWAAAALGLAAMLAFAVTRIGPADPPATAARTTASIVLPQSLRLSGPSAGRFALSPDGTQMAIVATEGTGPARLYIRRLDSQSAQPLAGTEDASFPFWSPDSRFVAFLAQNELRRIAVTGGDVATLASAELGATGSWSRDDVILFTPRGNSPLYRVSATSGTAVQATTLVEADGDVQHSFPSFLPDGRHFLFFVVGSRAGQIVPRGVYLGSLDGTTPNRLLIEDASNALYGNGHIVFLRGGVLFAQAFDAARLEVLGEATPLVAEIRDTDRSASEVTGAFTVSQTGVLAYQTASRVETQLTWYDRQGNTLGTIGEPGDYTDVALSPDGSRVATSVMNPADATHDVWTFDVARGLGERLTFGPGDDFGPNWSPDGGRMFFSSLRDGNVHLFEKPSSGSMAETLLYEDDLGKFNPRPSSDGAHLIYVAGGGIIRRSDIWLLDRSPAGVVARPFIETPFVESQPQFSPDARWVAFMSDKAGSREVYVLSFPDGEHETRVSSAGGSLPRWRRDGREIFYVSANGMLTTVPVVVSGDRLTTGTPRALFPVRSRAARLDAYSYDVAPSGDQILVNRFVEEVVPPVSLVINWPAVQAPVP